MMIWLHDVTYWASIAAFVWAVLQACDLVREGYLMPTTTWPARPFVVPPHNWDLLIAAVALWAAALWISSLAMMVASDVLVIAFWLRMGRRLRQWRLVR
jgi:hypothetical protein